MDIARPRHNESAAIAALHALDVLDSEPEAEFDALVRAASAVCGAPISAISLIDVNRQWFKAITGLPGVTETPRDVAFCAHVVLQDGFFEVPDATRDARFADNPLVTGQPDIRFYAGAPVKLSDGTRVGSMCVIDRQPRQLNATQREVLMCLAEAAARALEGRRALRLQQQATEAALQAELVLEHSADAIITVSAQRTIVRWNPAAERMFGYRADDIVGRPMDLLLPPDLTPQERHVMAHQSDGDAHSYETIRMHRDGHTLEVAITSVPLSGAQGAAAGTTQFVRDITERRSAERALREQTQRLQLATDGAGIGVWDFDLVTGALTFDDWMYRLYDLDPNDRDAPLMDRWAARLHPQDTERVFSEFAAALKGADVDRSEFRIVCSHNEVRHLQAAGRVLRDATGRGTRIIGVTHDVTQRQRTEEALREAKQAAEAASQSKSDFLANMSHEIRTPMNAILGMLTLLQRTELSVRQSDYVAKTEGAARALLTLLNDILDFSKVESGKLVLDPQPFDPEQLLNELSVIFSANVGAKSLDVLFDVAPNLPRSLVGDVTRLRQVLINLGGNAIKFTEHGEVVVSLHVVSLQPSEVTLEFAVRDTGIGIAPENQGRIFSAFTQAEASTTRRFGGTGLGLAICQRLVALMGGQLLLHSALGQGSRFSFQVTLPRAESSAAQALPSMHCRALFVDDNATARDTLPRLAATLGWQADAVANGEQALARLHAEPMAFDVVFVDAQMPGLNGLQTCERLHALPLRERVTVLLMDAAQSHGAPCPDTAAAGLAAPTPYIDGMLIKPATASMLHQAVMQARAQACGVDLRAPAPVSAPRRLEGLRLLVAEDNPNNQQVARELLEEEGAEVHIVDNGQEAVDAVTTGPRYDAVLMDLQMPVMDGYSAAQAIRGTWDPAALPIIAMTANAMVSDRDACLAAGMNDHVGKPFSIDQLVRVVCQHTRHSGPASLPASAAQASTVSLPASMTTAAKAAGVDLTTAVTRMGGHLRLYTRSLRTFVADLRDMPQTLRQLAASGDQVATKRLLHTLKGLAGTLGVEHLARTVHRCEGELAQEHQDTAQAVTSCEAVCREIATALDRLRPLEDALRQHDALTHPAPPPAQAPTPDITALVNLLQQLRRALQDSDMGAMALMEEVHHHYAHALGSEFQKLDDAIAGLDFPAAVDHCTALIETYQP